MTKEESHTTPPTGPPKVGWYRDRKSGQRKHWDGEKWTDISDAISPFVFRAQRPPAPPTPGPVIEPSVRPEPVLPKRTGMRSPLAVVLATVTALVAIVAATTMGHGSTIQSPRPAIPSFRAASATPDPSATTTSTFLTDPTETTTASTTTSAADVGALGAPTTTTVVTGTVGNVAVFGDSISAIAKSDITRDLHRYNLYIDAVGGTTMVQHLANIRQVASDGLPRDWVIELGTNDTLGHNPNWESDFANEVSALQTQHCVAFVTVNPTLGPIGPALNGSIADAVASHPNFRSIDWGSMEFRKPEWLRGDHIHPTPAGSAELAKLIRKAILSC